MKQKLMKRILIVSAAIAAVLVLVCRYYSFTPLPREPLDAFDPVYSDARDISPVIYEAVFPDNEEARTIFTEIRGTPVFAKIPGGFHMTTLFYPKDPVTELYGTNVRLHLTAYQCERFLDKDFHLTGTEGVKVEFECDDPKLQAYFDQFAHPWHITGSYMTDAVYASVLNFDSGKPIDYTIEGVFGAYCTGDHYCFDAACPVGLENRWPRK